MSAEKTDLERALNELYDIRLRRERMEKDEASLAHEVKRDINLMTLMFREGVDDIILFLNAEEKIEWDSDAKRIVYHKGEQTRFIEAANNETLIRVQPFLKEMVRRAQENYLV